MNLCVYCCFLELHKKILILPILRSLKNADVNIQNQISHFKFDYRNTPKFRYLPLSLTTTVIYRSAYDKFKSERKNEVNFTLFLEEKEACFSFVESTYRCLFREFNGLTSFLPGKGPSLLPRKTRKIILPSHSSVEKLHFFVFQKKENGNLRSKSPYSNTLSNFCGIVKLTSSERKNLGISVPTGVMSKI